MLISHIYSRQCLDEFSMLLYVSPPRQSAFPHFNFQQNKDYNGKFKFKFCYVWSRNQMQTRANAEIVVYSGKSQDQAERDSRYKIDKHKNGQKQSLNSKFD